MSTLTVAAELASRLTALKQPTEICDPDGKVIGVFTPQVGEGIWTSADLEEAERIAATEKEGFTLEQVMEHLRSLEKQA